MHNLTLPYFMAAGQNDFNLIRAHDKFAKLTGAGVPAWRAKERAFE
jgi:hypothetical protein